MNVYLVRITKDGKTRYKTGYTKWGKDKVVEGRFRYNNDYDGLNVELLAVKNIQHHDGRVARKLCEQMEEAIFNRISKKEYGAVDNIEEFFGIKPRAVSFGCTEFHHKDLQLTEEELIAKWLKVTKGKRYINPESA